MHYNLNVLIPICIHISKGMWYSKKALKIRPAFHAPIIRVKPDVLGTIYNYCQLELERKGKYNGKSKS